MNSAAPLKSLIQAITAKPGLALERVNLVLGTQMVQNMTRSNDYSLVYESTHVTNVPNLQIQRAELRLPGPQGQFNGTLSIYLLEPGLVFDTLRAELPELTLLQVPRGRAIDETIVFGYPSDWGSISLDVLERTKHHLTVVSFQPKPKSP